MLQEYAALLDLAQRAQHEVDGSCDSPTQGDTDDEGQHAHTNCWCTDGLTTVNQRGERRSAARASTIIYLEEARPFCKRFRVPYPVFLKLMKVVEDTKVVLRPRERCDGPLMHPCGAYGEIVMHIILLEFSACGRCLGYDRERGGFSSPEQLRPSRSVLATVYTCPLQANTFCAVCAPHIRDSTHFVSSRILCNQRGAHRW